MQHSLRGVGCDEKVSLLPNECWIAVFSFLEAVELSGCASSLCRGSRELSNEPHLWNSLLYADFCMSFAQRAFLRTWLLMHQHFHLRQLYIYKRREHLVHVEVARNEQQHRSKRAQEQDRKQRQVRILNFCLVRLLHVFLSASLLACSVLLWLRLSHAVRWSYWIIFSPMLAFTVFMLLSSCAVFTLYFLRSSTGWTFYWNRLRGVLRWFILRTTPVESAAAVLSMSSVLPLLVSSLEGTPQRWYPPFILPFLAFWVASFIFAGSLLRRRSFRGGPTAVALVLVWAPLVSSSALLFLRLSGLKVPMYLVFVPFFSMTCLLIIFVAFLVVASFWLGYRGHVDWTEYATVTLLTLLTLLVPLLLFQLVVLGYLNGRVSINNVFLPCVLWLSGLFACVVWHSFLPSQGAPPDFVRPWRPPEEAPSDMELLLPPAGFV